MTKRGKTKEPKAKKPRFFPTASYNEDENDDDEEFEEDDEREDDRDYLDFEGDDALSDGEIIEEDDGYDAKKVLLGKYSQ